MSNSIKNSMLSIRDLQVRRSESFELNVGHFELKAGETVCIVGANGSGKTTFIESITGIIRPNGDPIRVDGWSRPFDHPARSVMGFVPDDDQWIIPELTARNYFKLIESIHARMQPKWSLYQNAELLARELLFDNFDMKLGLLSHGNKKKVQIISALMIEPKIVIVDELRNGLDPVAIKRVESCFRVLAKNGVAIIAATHDLWWAQRFADRILMLNNGTVMLESSTKKIIREAGSLEAKFFELFERAHV